MAETCCVEYAIQKIRKIVDAKTKEEAKK